MKIRASLFSCLITALCIALAQPVFSADLISGKVVETMTSGGYTYVCLEKEGIRTWVAVPQMKVTVGSRMSFLSGAEMRNFSSKTLKRQFDRVIFSAGPASKATVEKAKGNLDWEKIKVKKAAGANAYTVSELYRNVNDLKGKPVVVSGKVVRFSPGIMQKNWIHLQDGSGDQKKGDHDLVITTKDTVAVGDTVTLTGTLAKDKDYGFGYKYPVIMENATSGGKKGRK